MTETLTRTDVTTTATTTAPASTLSLPLELAPSLAEQVRRLLSEVPTTQAPALAVDLTSTGPLCVVCHDGGKLGGHHGHDGRVEWIHKKCHRRLHRAGQPAVSGATRQRVLERRRRTAC